MLQSLADFNTYVDDRPGTVADKDAIKTGGATLARAAVAEAVAHANKHLNAVMGDNPADLEMTGRVFMLQRYLDSVEASDG
jgi:predicted nicotinamide N-methyase